MRKRLENYINLDNKKYRLLAEISKLERLQEQYTPSILNSSIGGVHSGGLSMPTENAAIKKLTFYEQTNAELEAKRAELNEVINELNYLDAFIEAIPDEQIKETVKLHYTQKVSWANIAIRWYYAPSSWFVIRNKVYDYLNQHDFI